MLTATLSAFVALLTYSSENATPLADWFVDASAMNCAAGNGTATAPFCTIAEAITAAVNGDTIRIAPGTYVENLTVGEDLRLVGTDGREVTFVDGGSMGRVFDITAGATVTIEGLTIRNGRALATGYAGGGGIRSAGSLTLRNSTVSGNVVTVSCNPGHFPCLTYGEGAGILLVAGAGATRIVNSTISDNQIFAAYGYGGGIQASDAGDLHIHGSRIVRNRASYFGGGVMARNTAMEIEGTAIVSNYGYFGGGLESFGNANVTIRNSTISGNQGNGLSTGSTGSGVVTVEGVTITDNYHYGSGAGWAHYGSQDAQVRSTIISGNDFGFPHFQHGEVYGNFVSGGHNAVGLVWPNPGNFSSPGDQSLSAPQLAPLAMNGGPTETHVPLPGSPVVDAGDPLATGTTDQRGFTRVGIPDIGAHEFGAVGGPSVSGCTSAPNSTGVAGSISAAGSSSASGNALTLSAGSLPNNALAIFLTSRTSGFAANPGGSSGNLCLSGAIGRFVGPGQVLDSGAGGAISLAIDLDRHPTPGGLVPVIPGDTWYFQCWHRDAGTGGPTSNFTAATQVTFTQ